jgi:hypothetical protein
MVARPDNRVVSSKLILSGFKLTIEFSKNTFTTHTRSKSSVSNLQHIIDILNIITKYGFVSYDMSQEYEDEGGITYISRTIFSKNELLTDLSNGGWIVKQI